MYRLHPSWVAVRELVAPGRIGRLLAVESWFSYFNDDLANIRNQRDAAGGALFDIGCYAVNLSRMLFGGEPTGVQRRMRRDAGQRRRHADQRVPRLRRPGSRRSPARPAQSRPARAHLRHHRADHGPHPVQHPARPPDRVLLTAGGDPPVAPATEVLTLRDRGPIHGRGERFAAAILDGLPTPTPAEDAVANMRVIERILAAADSAGSAGFRCRHGLRRGARRRVRSTATNGCLGYRAPTMSPSGSRA